MIAISVKDTMSRQLAEMHRGFKSRAYLKVLGADVLVWIKDNFEAQGLERPWEPLSPNTLVTRKKGGGILARLKNKYGYQLQGSDSVTVGGIDKRLLWHNEGTRPYKIFPKNNSKTSVVS